MKLETLCINTEMGTCVVNGKELKNVSALECYFGNGKWSLSVTRDIRYENPEKKEYPEEAL